MALPALRNGFVEDDLWVVKDRRVLTPPTSLRAILTEPYWPRSFGGRLWRPLVLASWALDERVSRDPRWFHAVNIAWSAVSAALLTLLAAELTTPFVGLIAGILFAVHPVHVEAVSSVVGRAELMAAAGFAIALLGALRWRRSAWWLLGVAAGSALAIGSKEHGVTLPVIVLLLLMWRQRDWRAAWPPALVAAVPIVLYFALRSGIAGGALNSGGMAPGLEGLSRAQRTIAMTSVSLEWWRLLLFPLHLSSDWSTAQVQVTPLLTTRLVLTCLLWIVAAIGAWGLRRRVPAAWLGLAWLVITISPVANVVVPTEIVLAERTLYLPSWGIMLALAALVATVPWRRAALIAVASVGVLFATRTILRNEAWLDVDHARAAMLRDAPKSYRTLWTLGDEAFANGKPGTGEQLLHRAMVAAPGIPGPVEDLAGYYSAAGLTPQAVDMLKRAIPLNETRTKPWMMMQDVLLAGHDSAEAARWAISSIETFPSDAEVLNRSLGTMLTTGRCRQGLVLLDGHRGVMSVADEGIARGKLLDCERLRLGG